jgi:hypothetical protein
MNKTIQNGIILTGITLGLAIAPMTAQSDGSSKMSKMGAKTTMMEVDKMSTEQKAALFDKLSDLDKNMATKMAGHDMSRMSSQERMAMTEKLSVDDKAMSYSKLAMSKHMDKTDKMAMKKAAMDKAAMDKAAMDKK